MARDLDLRQGISTMMRTVGGGRDRAAALALALATLALPATAELQGGLAEYRNPRYGFSLSVPTDTFTLAISRNAEAGAVWVSHDRQARLVAAAQPNTTNETLQGYRKFVIEQNYQGASIDYAPTRDTWFVLSGVKEGQAFYERVTFVCGGRYIYGWQMMYPISQRRQYDAIVEHIHRSYRAGQGEHGSCG